MKKVLIISILSMGFIFTSCDKDEACIASDSIGTYMGTMECDEMDPVQVVFQVTSGDSDIQFIVDGVTTVIDHCDIFGSSVLQGTGREIDGDIDGRKISFLETIKVNGQDDVRCVWKGVKN